MAQSVTLNGSTFSVGDTVDVHYRILEKQKVAGKTKGEVKEEQKERIQIFEGIVIAIRGKNEGKSFIVRRIGADNVGIERIFPFISPWIKTVVVKKQGDVRRAKLYYLRRQEGKDASQVKELKSQEPTPSKKNEDTVQRRPRRTTRRSASKK